MKRILSIFLTVFITFSSASVFADTENSEELKSALLSVKSKVDISDELTEFTSNSYSYSDSTFYNFEWTDKDCDAYINIGCDKEGRIISYNMYDSRMSYSKYFNDKTIDEVIDYSDAFLKKLVPEAFSDGNDKLVVSKGETEIKNKFGYVVYERERDGIKVDKNGARVSVRFYDGGIVINSVDIDFDYDAKFDGDGFEISDYEEKYKEAFPIEMIYRDKSYDEVYSDSGESNEKETVLLYRFYDSDAGYISAKSGEIVFEDKSDYMYGDSASGATANLKADTEEAEDSVRLTDREIEDIENVSGLMSKEDALNYIKSLPKIGSVSDFEVEYVRIFKDGEDYYMSISLKDDDKYISAKFDAKSKKLLRFENDTGYYPTVNVNKTQEEEAKSAISKFLNTVSKDELKECIVRGSYENYGNVNEEYVRIVNGVPYINDGIYISCNVSDFQISHYRLDFAKDMIFNDTKNTISESDAYLSILKLHPIEKIYVKSGGEYIKCFTYKNSGIEIDALSGDEIKQTYDYVPKSYDDIGGHWSENAVTKLLSAEIGLDGESFMPDIAISQIDMFKLLGSGIYYSSYKNKSEDNIYKNLVRDGIIEKENINPQGQVSREDMFMYAVRMMGYEKIAKRSDIFKVDFLDENLVSDGKTGYSAILLALDAISGDGGYLRPNEPVTRAETATVLYNYLNGK